MAKAKSAATEAEEELALAGYGTETAHGVNEDHPDETVEEWAKRIKENPEQATQEQIAAAEEQQEKVTEETAKEETDGS